MQTDPMGLADDLNADTYASGSPLTGIDPPRYQTGHATAMSRTTAYVVMTATFAVMWTMTLRLDNFGSFAILCAIYATGLLCRNKAYFWKMPVAFFGMILTSYLFRMFGGLEPNSVGVIAAGEIVSLDTLLFLLLVASLASAFLAGLRADRQRANVLERAGRLANKRT